MAEEIREVTEGQSRALFKPHFRAILSLLFLFLGFLAAFSIWYIVLPEKVVVSNFNSQIEQFCNINYASVQACLKEYGLSSITGNSISTSTELLAIFMNNLYVLLFTLVFSLAFGAGAIFILAWNASVIATAIGMLVRTSLLQIPTSLLAYLTHGIPEIVAYLVAALAGGILSTAVIRRDFSEGKFANILTDFLIFMVIAFAVLFIAALIEVYITPMLFF